MIRMLAVLASLAIVAGAARAASISLLWDPPTNCVDGTSLTNLLGHQLYFWQDGGTTNKRTCGTNGSATVSGLTGGTTFTFAVAAYNYLGESEKSNLIRWTAPTLGALPAAPQNVRMKSEAP
jgi:hypothetical protein